MNDMTTKEKLRALQNRTATKRTAVRYAQCMKDASHENDNFNALASYVYAQASAESDKRIS